MTKLQKDANSAEIKEKLADDISAAYAKGINGTPSTVINEKVMVGIKPYDEFKKAIQDAASK